MKKKTLLLIIIALFIIGSFLWFRGVKEKEFDKEGPIKIGALLALSGPGANYGERAKKGIELALEEFGDDKYEVIYEDCQAKSEISLSAYHNLIDIYQTRFMISVCGSSSALALSPLANRDQVILIDAAAQVPDYSSLGDYSFRTSRQSMGLAIKASEFIISELSPARVAVLVVNRDHGLKAGQVLADILRGLGVKVDPEEKYDRGAVEFKAHLTKIKQANVDVLYVITFTMQEMAQILKQMQELGLDIQIVSDSISVEGQELINLAGELSQGIIYTRAKADLDSFSKFQKKYNEIPTEISAQAYDAMLLLDYAIQRCAEPDTVCIKDELMQIKDFRGATGLISVDEYGDVIREEEIYVIQDGQFVPYE